MNEWIYNVVLHVWGMKEICHTCRLGQKARRGDVGENVNLIH